MGLNNQAWVHHITGERTVRLLTDFIGAAAAAAASSSPGMAAGRGGGEEERKQKVGSEAEGRIRDQLIAADTM